jgi:hypothetical protein
MIMNQADSKDSAYKEDKMITTRADIAIPTDNVASIFFKNGFIEKCCILLRTNTMIRQMIKSANLNAIPCSYLPKDIALTK